MTEVKEAEEKEPLDLKVDPLNDRLELVEERRTGGPILYWALKRDGLTVASVWNEENRELANLFHASADMLKALLMARAGFRHALEFFGWEKFPNLRAEYEEKLELIETALAKAKGEPR